jgi:hypothetical protein
VDRVPFEEYAKKRGASGYSVLLVGLPSVVNANEVFRIMRELNMITENEPIVVPINSRQQNEQFGMLKSRFIIHFGTQEEAHRSIQIRSIYFVLND